MKPLKRLVHLCSISNYNLVLVILPCSKYRIIKYLYQKDWYT
nr:MAG TPA: hypothetical protein [Caudoviricetes sp.]